MPKSYMLKYEECCKIRLQVDIHGTLKDIDALVDTGFTRDTGFGLKLPIEYSDLANVRGTGNITLADDRIVPARSIPNTLILKIEGQPVQQVITIPTIFMGTTSSIGVMFLKHCIAVFDGPREQTTITL